MTLWHPDPPQGFTSEQGLIIIGRPIIPRFGAPQGLGADVSGSWINDESIQFVNDVGIAMVFDA